MYGHRLLPVLSVLVALAVAAPAAAWEADFFDKDASGNASYEEMVISPEAVFDPVVGQTYLAYQGAGLDPHIIAYDNATNTWDGPYVIGSNNLSGDLHGAPSIVIDDAGYIFVFYGGHLSSLGHSRSARPNDISEWVDLGPVRVGDAALQIGASYPQPALEESGTIRLYYRRDDNASDTRGDWESIVSTGSALAPQWTEPEMLLHGVYGGTEYETIEGTTPVPVNYYWYADLDDNGDGEPAFAAIRRDFLQGVSTDYYVRKGVYYAERSAEGTWTNAAREELAPERDYASLQTTAAVLPEVDDEYTNQIVVRRDQDGVPSILYLKGPNVYNEPYTWCFARWSGTEWIHQEITTTDDLFDAGTFELMDDGSVEAFLTTGGVADDQWLDDPTTAVDDAQLAKRGGDITQWRLPAGGTEWTKVRDVIVSPGPAARYNNPQLVRGYDAEARLLFSEWNNDASNFIHKVYLWGNAGFRTRAFTPEITRLAGANRMQTAIEISRQGFPLGTSTAVLATANNFPDALCGVPLAQAYTAPILLTGSASLDPDVAAELRRLDVSKVIILGSQTVISKAVETSIKSIRNSSGNTLKVERVYGANRYATSVAIANKLEAKRGGPPLNVMLASGETFPDALTVSPYAARRGYPVLLTPRSGVATPTLEAIADIAPETIVVVGGEAAITSEVEAAYGAAAYASTERWAGPNRYATARVIAEHAVAAGHTMERFGLATAMNYADAVSGGLLAARMNGVLLITPPTSLHPEAQLALDTMAFGEGTGVLNAYILGGPSALGPEVENALAARLLYLDAGATP